MTCMQGFRRAAQMGSAREDTASGGITWSCDMILEWSRMSTIPRPRRIRPFSTRGSGTAWPSRPISELNSTEDFSTTSALLGLVSACQTGGWTPRLGRLRLVGPLRAGARRQRRLGWWLAAPTRYGDCFDPAQEVHTVVRILPLELLLLQHTGTSTHSDRSGHICPYAQAARRWF